MGALRNVSDAEFIAATRTLPRKGNNTISAETVGASASSLAIPAAWRGQYVRLTAIGGPIFIRSCTTAEDAEATAVSGAQRGDRLFENTSGEFLIGESDLFLGMISDDADRTLEWAVVSGAV